VAVTATLTADQRRLLARMDHYQITDQPHPRWCGLQAYARDLARAICHAAGGADWTAQARAPFWPSPLVDQHTQTAVTVDRRLLVVLTQTNPAGAGPERWTITVNGRPIPHRPLPGEVPHQIEPVPRSLWRHLRGIPVDPCDRFLCQAPATVATWGASTCPPHTA